MPFNNKTYRLKRGVSLIEVVVALAIFSLLLAGLYTLMNFGSKVLSDNRARVDAIALANKRVEMIRNLSYDDVGTSGGIPPGTIPQSEQVVINKISFTLATDIRYIDDPFDGISGGSPNDLNGADYKRVRIEVTWPHMLINKPVVITTDATPKGMEKTLSGGTLELTVFNALGQPVPSASVHIENTDVMPAISIDTTTQANGVLVLPGMPPSIETYDITVTKNGYSTDQTYEIDPVNNPNPSPPPLSVYENTVTQASFSIDLLGTVNIQTLDQAGLPIADVPFTLLGSKTIGTDGNNDPIYKFNQDYTTDAAGEISIADLEWDSYSFIIDQAGLDSDIAGANPPLPINLDPNATLDVEIALASPNAQHTLLVVVRDQNLDIVPNVPVQLTSTLPPYDETQTTTAWGQTFFTPLNQGDFNLHVQMAGYLDYDDVITIDGDRVIEIILTPV